MGWYTRFSKMHIRSRAVFAFLALTLAFALAGGGTIISNFQAQPGYNQVTLKWLSQNEVNLKGFEIERSLETGSLRNFKKVDFVKATPEQKPQKEYTYVDRSVFKNNARTFHYRLKIVDTDGKYSYSKVLSVTPTVSSARQTWGSIKAMFR